MSARTRREFERVEDQAQAMLARTDDPAVRRVLARLNDDLRRPDKALVHWDAISLAQPGDFEAAYNRLAPFVGDPDRLAQHLRETGDKVSEAFAENLRQVLLAPPTQSDAPPCRHIAICGVSFSGSTLLDRILGGISGVASIGESHWLIKEKRDGEYRLTDYTTPGPAGSRPHCTVCGSRCEVLNPAFRRGLAATRKDWYQRIAARLGTGVLVSADKNPPKIVDNDPLLRLDGLVLFKSPAQAWASHRAKLPEDLPDARYVVECEKYGGAWTRAYQVLMDEFLPAGQLHFLDFDAFTRAPMRHLEALCASLQLPFTDDILHIRQKGHAIGGNSNAMKRLRVSDYQPEIIPLPEPRTSATEAGILANVTGLPETFERLQARFRDGVGAGITAETVQ